MTKNNLSTAYVDLATYDELEKYLYGGRQATNWFVRGIRRSIWFSQIPITQRIESGTADFGNVFQANVSRGGDVLLYMWIRFTLPALTPSGGGAQTIAWTQNVGHHLFDEIKLVFNDIIAQKFDDHFLNAWTNFTTSQSKWNPGYQNMIGNVTANTTLATSIAAYTCNVPIPLFFSRNSGVGLMTAALPYNNIRVEFSTRTSASLLRFGGGATAATGTPALTNVEVWSNYAILDPDERTRIAARPRDMVIEQTQRTSKSFDATNGVTIDLRFSYAVKSLFFQVQRTNNAWEFSNYTTDTGWNGDDPVGTATLTYENQDRLNAMPPDYFSLVNPYFHWTRIPEETGYHVYTYALDPLSVDPQGSTNFSKLNNVSLELAAAAGIAGTYSAKVMAQSMIIARISGGSFGFPAH